MPGPTPAPARASEPTTTAVVGDEVELLELRVVREYPHDPRAFTQGLLWHGGALYESTGQHGESSLRRVTLKTGAVEHRVDLPPELFAEGLARVGERLIQLTWQSGLALVYDLASFDRVGELGYGGEGWGLCHDGSRLVMSDGSDRLMFRDPESFAVTGGVQVTLRGRPQPRLNELECVGEVVWANVWTEDRILRIDPASGQVTGLVDASRLLPLAQRAASRADVLNGIAYRPETDTYLLTGKYWPTLFEVKLIPKTPP